MAYWWQKEESKDSVQQSSEQQTSERGYWWQKENIGTTIGNMASNRVNAWLKRHNELAASYQKRYANRKFSYEDAYVSDSGTWLETATKQAEELDAERQAILAYLDENKDYLDADWRESVRNTLAKGYNAQQQMRNHAANDNAWWSGFGTDQELMTKYGSVEGVYNYYQRSDGYRQKYEGMNDEEISKALSCLEDGEEKDWLDTYQWRRYFDESDFDQYSKTGAAIKNPTMEEAENDGRFLWWEWDGADVGNIVTYSRENADALAMAKANNANTQGNYVYRSMEDDEVNLYNYLLAKYGKEKAGEFLNYIMDDLLAREGGDLANRLKGIDIPVIEELAIGAFGTLAGIDQWASGARQYIRKDLQPATVEQYANSEIANSLNGFGKYAYQATNVVGNMLPSIALSKGLGALGAGMKAAQAAGRATMFVGAAGNAYADGLEKYGMEPWQARTYGNLVGLAEVALESAIGGIPALSKADDFLTPKINMIDNSLLRIGAKIGWDNVKEIVEEEAQNYLEPLFRSFFTGEYDAPTFEELLETAIVTSISTPVMGGLDTAIDDIRGANNALKKYGGKTNTLIKEGLESDVNSESFKLAQKAKAKTISGKTLSGNEIRNLLAANQEQITPKDLKIIQKAAEKRLTELGQTEDVAKVAELAAKYATGQKITKAEKSFLARSEYGSRVVNELTPKNIESGEYTTDWAEEIGTRKLNAEAYNKKDIEMVRAAVEEMKKMAEPAKYKSLTERIGEDGRFGVSESGKAVIRATNEEIDINNLEVETVGDGQMTFKLEDGREVSAGEIDFVDDNQSYIVSAVSSIENISPASAMEVMKLVDTSKPLGKQLNAIDEAFTYGNHGYSEADLKAGEFAKNLTTDQLKRAYELGKAASLESDYYKADTYKKMRTAAEAIAEKNKAEGKEAPGAKNLTITFNKGNGEVVSFDEAFKPGELDEKRSGAVKIAEILHKLGLGTRVEFFESRLSDNLKVKNRKTQKMEKARVYIDDAGVEQIAYSGVYRKADGTIRIDLNAYNGRGLTLYALAHELTHFIQQWSDTKYKVLVDFLMETYEKTDMTMHERVVAHQKFLEETRGKAVPYYEAYDEVVANAMMKMFDDGKLVERLTELKAKDKNLAQKLWEGFKNLLAKIFDFYKSEGALFDDTRVLVEMKETFEQLQNMFADALVEASENYQASLITKEAGMEFVAAEDVSQYSYSSLAEAAGFVATENEDGTRSFTRDGKKVSKVTVEDIDNSPIGAFINFSVEMKDISEADAKRQKEMFAEICTMACKTNDFAMTMQFVGSAVFTGMKANADKQYGTTYDFPSICTKTQAVIDAMSAKMMSLGRGLNTNEIVKLYDDVFASGNPVPCPECYVFSRWIGIGGLLDNIKKYQDYYGDMAVEDVAAEYRKMKAEVAKFAEEQGISFGKAKGAMTSKLTKEFNKLTEKIEKAQNQGEKVKTADKQRLAELEPMMNTVKGMTWLENVYFADSSLKKVNPNFRVPNEVLFDLNNGEAFATKYKEAWAFRTTQGAGYGKAITPYAEARLGEGVLVTNNTTNAIKGRAQGTLNNYFLNQMGKLDKQSRDALKRARLKQKIQAFIGGQRFQSTSDARYENASDYLLASLEMQAMGGMVQVYTKVDGAVPAFSAWGFSINQSLMPLNGGLDADGNVKDTAVGGMKPSVAFENRNKHESAGTITIGVNDNHIRAMFKQWVRDFIIPYHASGGKADTIAEFRRIQEGKEAKGKTVRSTDYSRTQSDKVLSDEVLRWQGKTDAQIQRIHEIRNARIAILTGGKVNMTVVRSNRFLSALYDKLNGGEWDGVKLAKSKVESQIFPNEFWDQTVTYDESAKIVKDYLEYCEDLGFLHRFSGMIPSNGRLVPANGYNEKGERVQLTDLAYKYDEKGNKTAEVEEFFWKVLTDRRMYDNNGNYLPQKVVTLNDTTAETVTDFAKNNQGRQYDKAKAEALAKKITKGEQYSPQETDADAEKVYSYEGLPADAFYNEDYSYIYSYDFLTAQKDMTIVDSLPTLQELQTDRKIDPEKVLAAGYKNIVEMGGTKVGDTYRIINTYTNRPLQIGKSSITHGLGAADPNAKRTNARLAAAIGELCKNAIPICALPNTHNVRGTYGMAVLVNSRVNGKDMNMIALITVEQQNGNVQSVDFVDVAHAVSGRLVRDKEKENRSAQGTPPGTKSEWATRFSSTLRITQFLDIVNRTHQGYLSDDVISKLGEERRGPKKTLYSSHETEADNAPTFYSQMGKVVEGMKQDKFGASSVISMLRGRGVKAEEIRWSGIQAFLDGKKSVTKAELLDFINSSMLQIEEQERGENKKYSLEQQKRLNELEHEIDAAFDELWELWESEFDEDLPFELLSSSFVERRVKKIIETANKEANTEISEDSKRIIQLARIIDRNKEEAEDISYQAETPETKWSQYKLDGGSNYRELLFKLPDSTYSNTAMKGHWGEDAKGILAHARMQDFEVDGKKMLFIEEIQSDWHNAGSKDGYSTPETQKLIDEFYEIRSKRLPYHDKVRPIVNNAADKLGLDEDDVYHDLLNKDWNTIQYFDELEKHFSDDDLANLKADADLFKQHMAIREKMNAIGAKAGAAPDAPFKDGKYTDFVLKRLLRMAAEEGYDGIGWTTAKIQDDRWENTRPHKEGEGKSGFLKAYTIEYDQDIPKFLRKYGKQWGAEVGKTVLNTHSSDIERLHANIASWQQELYEADTDSERDFIQNQIDYQNEELDFYINRSKVWSMDITPAMKKSVLEEGQAMYSGHDTDTDSDGKQLSKEQVEFFANSKVRDQNGKLLVMYHGSQSLGFTVFEPNASDDNRSFFFSDSPKVAASYSNSEDEINPYAGENKTSGLYKTYLNLTNPYIVDAKGSKWNNIVEFAEGDEFLGDIGSYLGIIRGMDSSIGIEDFLDSLRGDLVGATEYAINELHIDEETEESLFTEEEQKSLLELAERIDKAYSEWDESMHLDEDGESTGFESYVRQNYTAKNTRKIASEAYKEGYDGVIFKNLVDVGKFGNIQQQNYEKSTVAVAFDSNQIKSVENKKPTTDPDMRYSGHETEYSNRDMLANAFETLSQNSEEYKMIQEYREKIEKLNKLDEKLSKINAEIHKVRFEKGNYDAERLERLENLAKETAKQINRQDKKLLMMEASEPLSKVIAYERKKAAQETKAHVKEIQQNKKLRAEQTELRHKIRKTVRDLDKLLKRGNKKTNVKEDMKGFVSKALELADYLFTDHISNDDIIRNGIDADLMRGNEAQLVKETEEILAQLYDNADNLTDEEFTRLDAKRKANEEKLRDLLTAQRNRNLETPVYKLFNDLVTEYASLKNSSQEAVKAAYDPNVERFLRSYIGESDGQTDSDRKTLLQNMRVADMTTDELWKLHNAYKMVLHSVREANNLHIKGKTETVEQMAGRIANDFSNRKIPDKKLAIAAQKILNKLGWDYEKLHYALDRIGSEAFTELFMNLAESENIVMADIIEAAAFRDEMVEKYGFNDWAVNKKLDREFLDNTGKKFRLTLGELMSLYAYSRREGAWDHIEYGGFAFGKEELTNPNPADTYKLSKKQCEAITDLLTKEQKAYVEDMQKFLSETMGEKGNEVSMMLYGIKMFGEKNYFPLHIYGVFKAQAQESQAKAAEGFTSMSNAGFTHAQNPNAKAPFVLEGFNEVWSDHVNEMSRYHGTVPALEAIRKVMNRSSYSESAADSTAIKQLMINKFGKEAANYFDNLYREANSGAITDKLQKRSKWLLSLFRKNSVAYSLSVLVQQPASVVRAYAMIDRKYFGFKGFGTITSGVIKAVSSKWNSAYSNAYNEMLKYAPGVTMAKEIGGFDTATGGSIRSHLLDTSKSLKQKMKTENALGKGKAVLDLVDNNAIANLPNVADKIAWIEIWNACKREAVATHKDLAPNSEKFMQAVGERFTEVIRATQVYDSIFAKSPMLKSKNLAVQYLVSFMNEPNTVANMVEKSLRDVSNGNWKTGLKTAVVVVHSILFTNMLKSLIYALRDDDEDETYIEKYIEAVTGNLLSDFNPLSYIPIARDVWSIAQGYDVERADMAVVADALDALDQVIKNAAKDTSEMTEEELIEFDKKVTESNWKLVESVATFFGIPVKNIRREVNAFIDHARIASANAGLTTKLSREDTIYDAVIESIPFMSSKAKPKKDKLYDAILSGDKTYIERIKSTYKDDDSYHTAVRSVLRENDSRVKAAAQAHMNGDPSERVRIAKQIIADGFDLDDVIMAINAEIAKMTPDDSTDTEKVKGMYKVEDFVREAANGDTAALVAIRDDILQTAEKNGKTAKKAEEDFISDVKSATKKGYIDGSLSDAVAEKILLEHTDMDEEEAATKISYWGFIKEHPAYDNFNQSNVEDYYEFAEPAEIPLDVFAQYVEGTKGIKTIKDKWGDEVKSKREQVLEVIDSLPLTWQQKDALYLAHGYEESTIWDVPW